MKNIKISFTQEELQLLYSACMNYGDKLSSILKEIPSEPGIHNLLSDRAKDAWQLDKSALRICEDEKTKEVERIESALKIV